MANNLNTLTYDETTRMSYPLNVTTSYALAPWIPSSNNVYYSAGNVGIGSSTFNVVNPEELMVDTIGGNSVNAIAAYGTVNSYLQINAKNRSAGVNASSDIVATNDTGNESGNYVNLGINSSTYTGSMVGQKNDGYLYNTGSDFYIGNTTTNKNLYLFAGGLSNTASITISSSGNFGIGTTTPAYLLEIKGTGSLGSYNNNFNCIAQGDTFPGYRMSRVSGVTKTNTEWGINIGSTGAFIIQNFTSSTVPFVIYQNCAANTLILSSSNVGVGTNAPAYLLHVNTDSAGKPGAGGLWTVVSDERIKKDIELADLDRCYEIVKYIPLKYFGWKDGVYTADQVKDRHNLGWIAQDVQKVFPKATSVIPFKNENIQIDDCLDLNSGQMIMAMYGALQKTMQEVELLKAEIKSLKNE